MERYRTAVIGAGASGLMAAWAAGPGTVLLEANPKPGKKLLATGNGRCNLSNRAVSAARYQGDAALAAPLLADWPSERVVNIFRQMGLLTRADSEGRLYPNSLQAAAVLKALCAACDEAGARTVCGFQVERVVAENGGFHISAADGRTVFARRCILACGGQASPQHMGGSGYGLAKSFGHSVTRLHPSLVGLAVSGKSTRALKGMRCRVRAALYRGSREICAESGEVIFGEGSVSGICVMNLSACLRGLGGGNISLRLDLLEDIPPRDLEEYLHYIRDAFPQRAVGELFAGALNLRVGQEVVKSLGWKVSEPLSGLSDGQISQAAERVKSFSLPVSGPLGWENAQVTAGGVPLREVDITTMESQRQKGLYLTGELLDLDGLCGGYNLHWAWATGWTAGRNAAGRELTE